MAARGGPGWLRHLVLASESRRGPLRLRHLRHLLHLLAAQAVLCGWSVAWCSCAMGKHGSRAHEGMLLLTHGTHQHLRRVRSCLAGALPTQDDLVYDVRQWRKAVRQPCQCRFIVETMLATAMARGPAALIHATACAPCGFEVWVVLQNVVYVSWCMSVCGE